MSSPRLVISDSQLDIILFRGSREEHHNLYNYVILVCRTDDDFPVDGELDEDGYMYYIFASGSPEDQYIYLTPDEADIIVDTIYEQTGVNVCDY
jgi:hypothetical protein